jgi:hypothetical protein
VVLLSHLDKMLDGEKMQHEYVYIRRVRVNNPLSVCECVSSPKPDLQCHYMSGLEMSLYHMDIHTYKWMVYSLVIIQPATEVGQGCKSLAPIVQYNTHSLTHRHHFIVSLSEQACMLRPQRLCKSCVHWPSPVEGSGPAILITTRDCSLAALCTTTTVYCCRFSRV